jgi:hypothetical protein
MLSPLKIASVLLLETFLPSILPYNIVMPSQLGAIFNASTYPRAYRLLFATTTNRITLLIMMLCHKIRLLLVMSFVPPMIRRSIVQALHALDKFGTNHMPYYSHSFTTSMSQTHHKGDINPLLHAIMVDTAIIFATLSTNPNTSLSIRTGGWTAPSIC